MSVFISHAHVDSGLAEGLKEMIKRATSDSIDVWFSSETRAGEGMKSGDWRKQIWDRIKEADTILVVISPQSCDRPWLVWESGFAEGHSKEVMPVLFWIEPERIHSVFQNRNTYFADGPASDASLQKMIGEIIEKQRGKAPDPDICRAWTPWIEQFQSLVELERRESEERTLFHDHFHTSDTAEKMSGKWLAQWTAIDAEGKEKPFEADSLRVWSDETRIRMVGDGAKGKPYPMEGVVSSLGQVALSYWSEGDTAICGTVLLKPGGGNIGSDLIGTWQGFTARRLRFEELRYTRGRVAMAKIPKRGDLDELEDEEGMKNAQQFLNEALSVPWSWAP